MASPRVPINPMVVGAIRDRFGIANGDIANLAGVKDASIVESWEAGSARPTLRQAEELVRKLALSLLDLFGEGLPEDVEGRLTDYRSASSAKSIKWRVAVQDASFLQQEYVRLVGDEVEPVDPRLPSVESADRLVDASEAIREILGVSLDEQRRWIDANEARLAWRGALEEFGFLVLHVRHVDLEEFRAFSIHSPIAPLIAVNSADGAAAHIFSYFHELGHLILRQGGACDAIADSSTTSGVERHCNQFAAEVLVPGRSLRARIGDTIGRNDVWDTIPDLARTYSVSRQVVAIRLRELDIISQPELNEIMESLGAHHYIRRDELNAKEVRIRYEYQMRSMYGSRLIDGVLSSIDSGRLSPTEGMDLLQTNADRLQKLRAIV